LNCRFDPANPTGVQGRGCLNNHATSIPTSTATESALAASAVAPWRAVRSSRATEIECSLLTLLALLAIVALSAVLAFYPVFAIIPNLKRRTFDCLDDELHFSRTSPILTGQATKSRFESNDVRCSD
jgi:hypothetical protein